MNYDKNILQYLDFFSIGKNLCTNLNLTQNVSLGMDLFSTSVPISKRCQIFKKIYTILKKYIEFIYQFKMYSKWKLNYCEILPKFLV